jgi:6-phosphogluconolactonase
MIVLRPAAPCAVLLALVALALPGSAPAGKETGARKLLVYVGTYTRGTASKGIYKLHLDLSSGKLTAPTPAGKTVNPSFLAIHPSRRYLYAVGEVSEVDGKKGGAINAFRIDPKTGDLKLLNGQSSGGPGPCHLVVDASGKHVLAANYGGGSACVLPIGADGRLGKATAVVQHKGKSVDPGRQEAPHAHSINLDRANRFAFVADLGLDKVMIYRYDAGKGTLTASDAFAAVAPGSGPRHFAFHPSGRWAYVINELANTITAFAYNGRGALKTTQTISTLPRDFKGKSYCAEVVVHPSGKFVYGSNRGHDSIAVFRVDPRTGKLTAAGHQSAGIKTPRNFAVDPTGAYLVVANQSGNSLVVFAIDRATGALKPTGHKVEVPAPVCVRLLPALR